MASSHCCTEVRKLATMMVSATARLSAATTPPTVAAAALRVRRARSSANSGSARWRANGSHARSSHAISQGSSVMPPINSSATDR